MDSYYFLFYHENMFQFAMFAYASAFNCDISGWDVTSGTEYVSVMQYNMYKCCIFKMNGLIFLISFVATFVSAHYVLYCILLQW